MVRIQTIQIIKYNIMYVNSCISNCVSVKMIENVHMGE